MRGESGERRRGQRDFVSRSGIPGAFGRFLAPGAWLRRLCLLLLLNIVAFALSAGPGRAQQESYRVYLSFITGGGSPSSVSTGEQSPAPPSPSPTPQPPLPAWLEYVNAVRAQAGLPPVVENRAWSDGAAKHARYMVKNDYVGHDEDPANPWFTPEGRDAGRAGNVLVSSNGEMSAEEAIDMWMQGPFHALGLLDPALRETGFGLYREEIGVRHFGATIDVLRGRKGVPAEVTFPVMWPGDGATVALTSYVGNEFPDPLSPCPGYQAPTGLPVVVQFGGGTGTPRVEAHAFRRGNVALEHCVFDETSYTNESPEMEWWGRNLLNARDAVILVPRDPLEPGSTYTVSLTVNGATYTWSFTVEGRARRASSSTNVLLRTLLPSP